MTKLELANQLKQRQLGEIAKPEHDLGRMGIAAKRNFVMALEPDQIIEDYTTYPVTRKRIVEGSVLDKMIEYATDAKHFRRLLSSASIYRASRDPAKLDEAIAQIYHFPPQGHPAWRDQKLQARRAEVCNYLGKMSEHAENFVEQLDAMP